MLLLWILGISVLEIAVSLVGQVVFFLGKFQIKKYMHYFVSFAVGTLMGVVFLDILPEAARFIETGAVFKYALAGFVAFFILSRFLFWYHCHNGECPKNGSPSLIILGAATHNFIDGAIIAFSFVADFRLGLIAAFAILLHKIPKEMSDFFVLIHRGYDRKKALLCNFFAATVILAGAAIAYFFSDKMSFIVGPALGIAAGNFLYIAATDLLPELNEKRQKGKTAVLQVGFILSGIFVIYFVGMNFK